jgi:hypothetical protein
MVSSEGGHPAATMERRASGGRGVLRLLIFFAMAGSAALGLDRLISRGLRSIDTGEFGVINRVVGGRVNARIVVTGSSRALAHFDPRILAQTTGRSAFNIGRNGAQTDMQVAFLRTYLRHNAKPSLVLHSVDAFSFVVSSEIYNPVQYVPYLDEPDLYAALGRVVPHVWKWRHVPLYGYAVEDMRFGWLLGIQAFLGRTPAEDHFLGFKPDSRPWTEDFGRFQAAHPDGVEFGIKPEGVAEMEGLVTLCKSRGIPLLLVFSPEYHEMQALQRDRPAVLSRLADMATRYGVPFWDYSASEISRDRECFYNSQHLNAHGARRFSEELGRRLGVEWSRIAGQEPVFPLEKNDSP